MSDVVISAESISKSYKLYHKPSTIQEAFSSFFGKKKAPEKEVFWALKEVSFELKQGDVLGIVGKNGAGKSTLLKILSEVTPPTSGQITIQGNVNALLEVGTGFHPDLTGRENVFLNGGILGMKKPEINALFDQIVDFAEISEFIDTPVKHYSSGMYMRLAFAIAIHLRFDILILDEILAVGDADFQKKCLQYIQRSIHNGKSVIMCSHNYLHLNNFCNKGLVLQNGKKTFSGTIQDSLKFYHQPSNLLSIKSSNIQGHRIDLQHHPHKTYTAGLGMTQLSLQCDHTYSSEVYAGCHFSFEVAYHHPEAFKYLVFGFAIKNSFAQELLAVNNLQLGIELKPKQGTGTIEVEIPQLLLYKEGAYSIDLFFGDNQQVFDVIPDAVKFNLKSRDVYQSGVLLKDRINQYYQPDLKMKCI
jgi:lipopolysaccharide transport system ATP-binding protein